MMIPMKSAGIIIHRMTIPILHRNHKGMHVSLPSIYTVSRVDFGNLPKSGTSRTLLIFFCKPLICSTK